MQAPCYIMFYHVPRGKAAVFAYYSYSVSVNWKAFRATEPAAYQDNKNSRFQKTAETDMQGDKVTNSTYFTSIYLQHTTAIHSQASCRRFHLPFPELHQLLWQAEAPPVARCICEQLPKVLLCYPYLFEVLFVSNWNGKLMQIVPLILIVQSVLTCVSLWYVIMVQYLFYRNSTVESSITLKLSESFNPLSLSLLCFGDTNSKSPVARLTDLSEMKASSSKKRRFCNIVMRCNTAS